MNNTAVLSTYVLSISRNVVSLESQIENSFAPPAIIIIATDNWQSENVVVEGKRENLELPRESKHTVEEEDRTFSSLRESSLSNCVYIAHLVV